MKTNILRQGNKFSRFYGLAFVLIIAAAGYTILYQSRAAQDTTPPAVYLLPDKATYGANTQFTVPIRANSGTTGVNAVSAQFTYPTSLVDFVSLDTSTSAYKTCGTTTTPTGAVSENCGKTVAANGTISIERGLALGDTPLVGDQLIATATFRTKTASGTGLFAFTDKTVLLRADDTVANIVSAASAKRGLSLTVDTAQPSVSVTNPTAGLSISRGSTVPINVNATDASPITKVEILVDGVIKTTLTTAPPYTYSWNTTGLSLGAHTIQARATDSVGLTGQSSTVSINLVDNTAPSVSLIDPKTGATVQGTITVSANASDGTNGTGISKVEFYEGTNLIGTDATSPYSISWNTASVGDGTKSITARAYDGASPVNVQTSTAANITVANNDTIPPLPLLGLKVDATTASSVSLSWNASTDDRGTIAGYRITRTGATAVTVPGLTYTATGLDSSTSYTFTVVALDPAGNPSTPASITATTQAPKVGDFSGNGSVGLEDLAMLLTGWDGTDPKLDLNKNGRVDLYDLSLFLSNYGK